MSTYFIVFDLQPLFNKIMPFPFSKDVSLSHGQGILFKGCSIDDWYPIFESFKAEFTTNKKNHFMLTRQHSKLSVRVKFIA